jgi:hypothetical protein
MRLLLAFGHHDSEHLDIMTLRLAQSPSLPRTQFGLSDVAASRPAPSNGVNGVNGVF